MRTEGVKAFSKRTRPCSVDGRKRYENVSVEANLFENVESVALRDRGHNWTKQSKRDTLSDPR